MTADDGRIDADRAALLSLSIRIGKYHYGVHPDVAAHIASVVHERDAALHRITALEAQVRELDMRVMRISEAARALRRACERETVDGRIWSSASEEAAEELFATVAAYDALREGRG